VCYKAVRLKTNNERTRRKKSKNRQTSLDNFCKTFLDVVPEAEIRTSKFNVVTMTVFLQNADKPVSVQFFRRLVTICAFMLFYYLFLFLSYYTRLKQTYNIICNDRFLPRFDMEPSSASSSSSPESSPRGSSSSSSSQSSSSSSSSSRRLYDVVPSSSLSPPSSDGLTLWHTSNAWPTVRTTRIAWL